MQNKEVLENEIHNTYIQHIYKSKQEMKTLIIQSPEYMQIVGTFLAKQHKILLLEWDLGAGKTTLSKGFAKWLGIEENKVQSPTYTYINTYDNKLLHVDMWRLESYEDLVKKGIQHEIEQAEYILIERPKFTDQLDLYKPLHLTIKKISHTQREIFFWKELSTDEFHTLEELTQTEPYEK